MATSPAAGTGRTPSPRPPAPWPPSERHPTIEAGRLRFRAVTEADLPDLIRWRSDPDVVRFFGPPPAGIDEARREYLEAGVQPTWAFVIEHEGRGIGEIHYSFAYPPDDWDDWTWWGAIDIAIGEPSARDRGVGTEAVRAMARYLFSERGCERVTIDPEVDNHRAIRTYQKAGFAFEGVLRHGMRSEHPGAGYLDMHYMSILRSEWEGGVVEPFEVRPLASQHRDAVAALVAKHNASERVVSLGRVHDTRRLPGFVAWQAGRVNGAATLFVEGDVCEVVTLDARYPRRGVGRELLRAAVQHASGAGCRVVRVVTTNDNAEALRFYQREGFRLVALHPGAVDRARTDLKPEIPRLGDAGLPIRDELVLELPLEA